MSLEQVVMERVGEFSEYKDDLHVVYTCIYKNIYMYIPIYVLFRNMFIDN